MIVMKFGGSSVSTGERIANVARIAAKVRNERGTPPVVVVSAMGGVTDSLVRAAESSVSGDARTYRLVRDELQQRHEQAIVDAGIGPEHARGLRAELSGLLDWFETLCQSMHTLGEVTPRGLGSFPASASVCRRASRRRPCSARGCPPRRWKPRM